MQKKIIIAPVDADSSTKDVFSPVKEFPTERMVLLSSPEGLERAEELKRELERLSIPATIIKVTGSNPWEDYFTVVSDVIEGHERENVVINIATADRISQCALTNAAHVNGIKAVAVIDGKLTALPILKLSLSSMISPKKMRILEELHKAGNCYRSMEELSKKAGMSLQLLSYHLNGTSKSDGMVQLELVNVKEEKGRVRVCLSTMGRLFMKGYLKP
jgi:DNA-binding transcriptional ArsR family regulator